MNLRPRRPERRALPSCATPRRLQEPWESLAHPPGPRPITPRSRAKPCVRSGLCARRRDLRLLVCVRKEARFPRCARGRLLCVSKETAAQGRDWRTVVCPRKVTGVREP